jgi:hypothetical protein
MKTLFKSQSLATFTADTKNENVRDADVMMIICKKPSGEVVEFNATLVPGTTKITYNVVPGDLNESGQYVLQAFFSVLGLTAYGAEYKFGVSAPLKIVQ